jgi:hypothetical protein
MPRPPLSWISTRNQHLVDRGTGFLRSWRRSKIRSATGLKRGQGGQGCRFLPGRPPGFSLVFRPVCAARSDAQCSGERPGESETAASTDGSQQSQTAPRVGWAQPNVCFFSNAAVREVAVGSASTSRRSRPALLRCANRGRLPSTDVAPTRTSSIIDAPSRATQQMRSAQAQMGVRYAAERIVVEAVPTVDASVTGLLRTAAGAVRHEPAGLAGRGRVARRRTVRSAHPGRSRRGPAAQQGRGAWSGSSSRKDRRRHRSTSPPFVGKISDTGTSYRFR